MSTPIENNTEELRNILQQVNELPEGGVDVPSDAVRYTEQDLTPEQQAQARANIDAMAASELPEAVNDALAQAKASGEFDGDAGTSVTVKSVSESAADGGSNVVTFSDGKTLTVRNGSKGIPGDDYVLTTADKEEIAELAAGIVDTALLALIGTGEVTA